MLHTGCFLGNTHPNLWLSLVIRRCYMMLLPAPCRDGFGTNSRVGWPVVHLLDATRVSKSVELLVRLMSVVRWAHATAPSCLRLT